MLSAKLEVLQHKKKIIDTQVVNYTLVSTN